MSNIPFEENTTQEQSSTSKQLPVDSMIGQKIGSCTIKSILGSGGMGTVYEAIQENPRRRVALKMIKSGVTSRSAIRRFEFESQTLARLKHSGVAQIYEAGTHDDGSGGLPYFIMEYIPNAKTLTEYVNDNNLGLNEKLDLFINICNAVQHGHLKGIVHRDLKPGNILVDTNGQPKIIDFGVAKSTDSDMAVTTLQTDVGQLIGTFQYMSPEQCDADPSDIDVRSDVYALGVILYELLTGNPPYDLHQKAVHEAIRIVREVEPMKLSTINRKLRGDLETITLKALAKNRARRYQSANDIEEDLKRYLNDDPISARPPSILDHLLRFIRKNTIAASLVFALLTVVVAVATAGGWISARYDRDRAIETTAQLQIEQNKTEALRAESQELEFEAIKGRVSTLVIKDSMTDILEKIADDFGTTDQLSIISPPSWSVSLGTWNMRQKVVEVPIDGLYSVNASSASSDYYYSLPANKTNLSLDVLDKLLEDLSYRHLIKVIVFTVDSDDDYLRGVDHFYEVIAKYQDRFKFITYVKSAKSAASFIALRSDFIVFHPEAVLGGVSSKQFDQEYGIAYESLSELVREFIDRDTFADITDNTIDSTYALESGIAQGIANSVEEAVALFKNIEGSPLNGRKYEIEEANRYIEFLATAYSWSSAGRVDQVLNESIQHLYDIAEGRIDGPDCDYLTESITALVMFYETSSNQSFLAGLSRMKEWDNKTKLAIMIGLNPYVIINCDDSYSGDTTTHSAEDALKVIRFTLKDGFAPTGLIIHFIDVGNYQVAEKLFLEYIDELDINLGPKHAFTIETKGKLAQFYELKMGLSEKAEAYRLKYDLQP